MQETTREHLRNVFARNLNRMIRERGCTAKQVSQECGITEAEISRLRHGTRTVQMRTIIKLALHFGVDLCEFFREV